MLSLSTLCALAGIRFENITLDHALEKAKSQNKLVFVDTYASWCAPCKVMDKVFSKNEIGKYFNRDFINIKIDMDGSQGSFMQNAYGVVWLPTMLILDGSGNILMKLDKVVTPGELIDYANEARVNRTAKGRGLSNNPFPEGSSAAKKQDYDPNEKEEVIYVYDERESSGRPHIMYHEAYLHLQLSDGKHRRVVKKYLSTQKDWSSEKNIKFIFDFLDDVNSELFEYFINNRWRFEEVIGSDKVRESLGHLINHRIEQGYPRPGLTEYIKLYKYIDPTNGEQLAYRRFLSRLLEEKKDLSYIQTATSYIERINPYDHGVLFNLADLRQKRSDASTFINDDINLVQEAIVLESGKHEYFSLLSSLHLKKNEKQEAIDALKNAIALAPDKVKKGYKKRLSLLEQL